MKCSAIESEDLHFNLEVPGRRRPPEALSYILVRNSDSECWRLAQFTHFEEECVAVLGGNVFIQWLPYRNNRPLLGSTDSEWHRDFKFQIGDRVKLADGVIKGHVAIVFHDESFEYNPYRVDWDDGSFGFYDDDELDPVEEESMPAMKNEEKAIDGTKQYRD